MWKNWFIGVAVVVILILATTTWRGCRSSGLAPGAGGSAAPAPAATATPTPEKIKALEAEIAELQKSAKKSESESESVRVPRSLLESGLVAGREAVKKFMSGSEAVAEANSEHLKLLNENIAVLKTKKERQEADRKKEQQKKLSEAEAKENAQYVRDHIKDIGTVIASQEEWIRMHEKALIENSLEDASFKAWRRKDMRERRERLAGLKAEVCKLQDSIQ